MADAESQSPRPDQQETPQKPQYQNGVRTTGRAFNSANWRMKRDESPSSPQQTPNRGQNSIQNGDLPASRPRTSGFGGRSGQSIVPQAISEGRRLYVGNMPYTAKMEDVQGLFERGGFAVSRIDIAIDPFSGRNPSYCFVDLETKELAERAMTELDGGDLLGRPVKIKPGVVKSASERQQQQRTSVGAVDGSSPSSGSPRGNRTSPFNTDRWRRDENASAPATPSKSSSSAAGQSNGSGSGSNNTTSDPSRRLYVGGLPRLTDQDAITVNITNFFKDFKVTNITKLFTPHPAKRFDPGDHYYLFVDFATVQETQNAMAALNGAEGPWGSPIRVQRARGETWNGNGNGNGKGDGKGDGNGIGTEERERNPVGRWGSSNTGRVPQAQQQAQAGEGVVEA
ncbi:hypothetical protein BDV12DRAFT_174785 [Aspergillus spectabilis]